MKKHIILLFFLTVGTAILTDAADRTFRFVNKCQQTVWIGAAGVKGQMPPQDGGFQVEAGQSKEIKTSGDWESGRFWPRTGCKDEDGKFTCATGNCGSDMNGFAMQCKGTTNEKPSTLAEFTLQSSKNKPDFYDLSNVDGHSIGMSIKPIEGQFQQVDDPDLGQYNCGAPSCTFDSSKCPEELKVNDGQGGVACTSICAAIHNAQQREKHEHLKKIFENEDARSLVCCSSDQHYDRAPTDEEHVDRKKCLVTNWPKATDGQQYDQVFKSQCPDAYSWQFDDHKSTYQCKEASYEITLCPSASAPLSAAAAEEAVPNSSAPLSAAAAKEAVPHSSGTENFTKTTRKLAEYLASREDTTVAAVSKEPMNETESPEAAQCHSYCVANLDYYKSLKAIPADNVTQSETEEKKIVVSVEPPSNGTNENAIVPVGKSAVAEPQPAGDDVWQRVFEDEFNQDGPVDGSKWRFEIGIGQSGWGNNELQYYRVENAQCTNGQLLIEARREDFEGCQYTSARMKSQKAFTYGRLQIRAKLPSGKGSWSALWMLAEAPGWPQNGEIDLMEQIGSEPSKIHSAVHTEAFNHIKGNQPTRDIDVPDAITQHKIYTLQWDADKIEMFIGSDETNPQETSILKWEKEDKDQTGWPFDKPFNIIMNIAVGGNLGGKNGIDESSFPQRMEIDWVRLDQKKQSDAGAQNKNN